MTFLFLSNPICKMHPGQTKVYSIFKGMQHWFILLMHSSHKIGGPPSKRITAALRALRIARSIALHRSLQCTWSGLLSGAMANAIWFWCVLFFSKSDARCCKRSQVSKLKPLSQPQGCIPSNVQSCSEIWKLINRISNIFQIFSVSIPPFSCRSPQRLCRCQ